MNKLDSYLFPTEMMVTKNKKKRLLVTEQDIEAAQQLIQLKNFHRNVITTHSYEHFGCQIHEPFMKIVLKSKEFLQAQDINVNHDNDDDDNKNDIFKGGYESIRKRKRDGTASCSSSITFDLDDSSDDEDANEAVGSVKKMKKYRSIVDIYNVTKPL